MSSTPLGRLLRRTNQIMMVAVGLCAASRALAAESGSRWRFGAGAQVGFMQLNNVGPWLGVVGLVEWDFASFAYLASSPGLVTTWNTAEDPVREFTVLGVTENGTTDDQLLFALPVPILAGLRVGPIGIELGPVVGYAVNSFSSSRCGDETHSAVYIGAEGGLAVHFGATDQFLVQAHGVMHTLPSLSCTNTGYDETTGRYNSPAIYHEEDFETVGGFVTAGMFL